jgi:hypothetical protein
MVSGSLCNRFLKTVQPVAFRFEWKVKNQQEAANAELTERRSVASNIVDLLDWLRAVDIKVHAAPLVGHGLDLSSVEQSIQDNQVCGISACVFCDSEVRNGLPIPK